MLNRILKRNFENHWIFTRFGGNVCQNFKFFFSYQVSFLFLSNNVMNDESNDPKTFSWCFYVTWTPWCHWCCLLSLQTKVKSQFCRIFYPKSYFKINQEYTYNQYHWLFIIILLLPSSYLMLLTKRMTKTKKNKNYKIVNWKMPNPIWIKDDKASCLQDR